MTRITTPLPFPKTPEAWLAEILLALKDARSTKLFALFTGTLLTEAKLFHLAPQVALKFRGLQVTEQVRNQAVEAALSHYVAFTDVDDPRHVPGLNRKPELAFALCYVATHFEMDLVTEQESEEVMSYCEMHLDGPHSAS